MRAAATRTATSTAGRWPTTSRPARPPCTGSPPDGCRRRRCSRQVTVSDGLELEPGRITGLLQRHRHRHRLRSSTTTQCHRVDPPAHVRRVARRWSPGRADRRRRRRRVDCGVQRRRRLPLQPRGHPGGGSFRCRRGKVTACTFGGDKLCNRK